MDMVGQAVEQSACESLAAEDLGPGFERQVGGYLVEKLQDPQFMKLFEQERLLAELSLQINSIREQKGLSQQELSKMARITQQQLSKIENGINCNLTTFLKVCHALELDVELKEKEFVTSSS